MIFPDFPQNKAGYCAVESGKALRACASLEGVLPASEKYKALYRRG
jgi:hypothetical protein